MGKRRNHPGRAAANAPVEGPPAAPSPLPLPVWKRVLFGFVGFVLLPLALLGVIEIGLRLAGFGYDPSFYRQQKISQEAFLVENDRFGWSFFPREVARSPSPARFKPDKAPGVTRIFVLGESAALGDPRPAYGAPRYLQVLLEKRFPGKKFEVIPAAMTAINSHALLPIAREIAALQGDAWVVYMGNNEMIGPYGATTVFGRQAPPLWQVRTILALQRTRLGQALFSLARQLAGGKETRPAWGGMGMFVQNQVPPDSPEKAVVYANFEKNLADILNTAGRAGIPTLLSTVAVNLKDSPPFASVRGTNEAAALSKLQPTETPLSPADSASKTRAALDLEPLNAELHYRAAELSRQQADPVTAKKLYEQACDLDALPFRSDSRVKAILTGRGSRPGTSPAIFDFLDAAALFSSRSPDGVPGEDFFFEHVHFNFEGNYLLALHWAMRLEQMLTNSAAWKSASSAAASTPVAWAGQPDCDAGLALTDWNRGGVLGEVSRRLQQPPFTLQLGREERLVRLEERRQALREQLTDDHASEADAVYQAAIASAPDDHRFRENYAEFLEARNQLEAAVVQWMRVTELLPHHHLGWFQSGRVLARLGKNSEARQQLTQAVTLRPDLAEGWLELGILSSAERQYDRALTDYERARALNPNDPRVHYFTGLALAKAGRATEGIPKLQRAVELRPDYWEARYALGEELAFAGRVAEARTQFEEVVRLRPSHAMAHFNLGVALVQEGRLEDGIRHFEETLRIDPGNARARDALQRLRK